MDKCLPFGASISCSHFQRFSDAIAHIVRFRVRITIGPINYLDDYLFLGITSIDCDNQVSVFLWVCEKIRFPVSEEKTEWSCTNLTFLGFLIDTIKQIVAIPTDKVQLAIDLIEGS